MAKLNNLDLPELDEKKSSKNIAALTVHGDAVTRYNEACDTIATAEEIRDQLKPVLMDAGLAYVFEHNEHNANDPAAQISSVNLQDADTGEVCLFSWLRKNLKINAKAVDAEFKGLFTKDGKRANINEYVSYVPVAAFDTGVFMKDGKFDKDICEDFQNALNEVADRHGVANPLTLAKVLQPKPDFHSRRWQDFDFQSNLDLQSVIPTQVNLKPVRPDKS